MTAPAAYCRLTDRLSGLSCERPLDHQGPCSRGSVVLETDRAAWVLALADRAEARARDLDEGPTRALALSGVSTFREPGLAAAVGRRGEDVLRRLLMLVGLGQDVGQAVYSALRGSDFERRRRAMQAGTAATYEDAAQAIEDGELIRAKLIEGGEAALRLAVPLLLAAL